MKSPSLAFAAAVLIAAPAAAQQKLHARDLFNFDSASGFEPAAGVIVDAGGTLYGMNEVGGNGGCDGGLGCGTVYALEPPVSAHGNWILSVLYDFKGTAADGGFPQAPLTMDATSGALYGFTAFQNEGAVFRLTPPGARGGTNWTFKVLYTFQNQGDGNLSGIFSPLVFSNGALYGLAQGGSSACGQFGCGSVFKLTPDDNDNWTEQTLYTFQDAQHVAEPSWIAGPDAGGALYVTTVVGTGAVVQLTPPASGVDWNARTIATFGAATKDPTNLLLAQDGSLFGIASRQDGGFAFHLTPPVSGHRWGDTIIAKIADHHYSPDSLAFGPDGTLIGSTLGDFDFWAGDAFQLTPQEDGSWSYAVLWEFNRGPDRNPENVVTGYHGKLFGVLDGGDSDGGGLFELR
jgi:hypothetical protein